MSKKKIVVVGAGPVGSLAALYAAARGYEVEVYELRSDLRAASTKPLNFTKSINLALSERGINAIRQLGDECLLETVLAGTIPMRGRMIHTRSPLAALVEQSQMYDVNGNFLRSVDRGALNSALLDHLDSFPNVKLIFQHKLTGADFKTKRAWFEDQSSPRQSSRCRAPEIEIQFDFLIGADGAHSATRFHMMKFARMDYRQEYIDCLWCEFRMPPSPTTKDFAISPEHLHIWPAGSFMFIALPDQDKSFVCTLFGPVSLFAALETGSDDNIWAAFDRHFPGVTNHIPPSDLIAQFRKNPHLPLIHIKCAPHHYGSSVAIVGDAAHAMVPFYGQGMNAGFESVRILFEHLDASPANVASGLQSYTAERTVDAYAVADLALENYIEMRSSVTRPLYKWRKWIEEALAKYVPGLGWTTQYARVSFTNLRYSEVVARSDQQKRVLSGVFAAGLCTGATASVAVACFFLLKGRHWGLANFLNR